MQKFGLPKARRNRTIQLNASEIADVDGETDVNDRFRSVLSRERPHPLSGGSDCLVPADTLPPRVRVALRASAAHRIQQPLRVVDEFRRGAALDAERLAGRVIRIGVQRDEPCVLNSGD
jgi:hypothetical protein